MNAFVRRLAALSALWALCELLGPEGRTKRLVRLTLGALMMTTLISALCGLLGQAKDFEWDAPAFVQTQAADYGETALRAAANQAQGLCVRVADRAGYDASAVVYLRRDGTLDHIALALAAREGITPLISPSEVASRLAALFEADEAAVRLEDGGA